MRGEKKTNILHQSQGTRKKPPKRNKDINGKWWVPSYLYNGSHYPVILAGSGYGEKYFFSPFVLSK